MPRFDRLLSRLRDFGVVLGDWVSDAVFFVRYHLAAEIKVRAASLIPEIASAFRRLPVSPRETKDDVSGSAAPPIFYKRVVESTPEPVKAGYRAVTKTEGSVASSIRSTVCFLALLSSFVVAIAGFTSGSVWLVLSGISIGAFAAIAVFTQETEERLVSESMTVESISSVSVLGDGYEALITIETVSLGGEVREYSIMRDDLTIIDSQFPRAEVSCTVIRSVSRNAFGWVMMVGDSEIIEITAYTPLSVPENESAKN